MEVFSKHTMMRKHERARSTNVEFNSNKKVDKFAISDAEKHTKLSMTRKSRYGVSTIMIAKKIIKKSILYSESVSTQIQSMIYTSC